MDSVDTGLTPAMDVDVPPEISVLPSSLNKKEVVCVDLREKEAKEKLDALCEEFGITNLEDMDRLFTALLKGYTKVESVSANDIELRDPDLDPDDYDGVDPSVYISLGEPLASVPDEYLSEFEKVKPTELELEMEQRIKDDDAEGVVGDFDLSIFNDPEDPESQALYDILAEHQKFFGFTQDKDIRRDLFCRMLSDIIRMEGGFDGILEENESTALLADE